jgi:hypothetical protein
LKRVWILGAFLSVCVSAQPVTLVPIARVISVSADFNEKVITLLGYFEWSGQSGIGYMCQYEADRKYSLIANCIKVVGSSESYERWMALSGKYIKITAKYISNRPDEIAITSGYLVNIQSMNLISLDDN